LVLGVKPAVSVVGDRGGLMRRSSESRSEKKKKKKKKRNKETLRSLPVFPTDIRPQAVLGRNSPIKDIQLLYSLICSSLVHRTGSNKDKLLFLPTPESDGFEQKGEGLGS
jgi:hypothetical protein